jgi:spore coat protein U-like protein
VVLRFACFRCYFKIAKNQTWNLSLATVSLASHGKDQPFTGTRNCFKTNFGTNVLNETVTPGDYSCAVTIEGKCVGGLIVL